MKKGPWLLVGMMSVGCLMAFAAAFSLLARSGAFDFAAAASEPPRIGQPMADFSLKEIDGRTIRLSDFQGRPVLINFWATWCPPCVAEMPYLNDFFLGHEASGFVILAINSGEPVDTAASFTWEKNLEFLVLTDPDGTFTDQMAIHSFPTSIFVGADGIVKAIHVGSLSPDQLDNEFLPLLEP